MSKLEIKNLHVSVNTDQGAKQILKGVDLTISSGETHAVMGPNGSGKTTTFYSIAGLVTPESGSVTIDGKDITTLPMYRRARLGIGYLPQEVSIFRGLSVEDNILAVLEIREPDRHKRRERLEALLSEFSIEHLRRAPALALSGGERRRAEIARCLAAGPKYVLLDEPFEGVAPALSKRLADVIAGLKGSEVSVLIAQSDLNHSRKLVDREFVIERGANLEKSNAMG